MTVTKQYAVEFDDGDRLGPWPVTSKREAREMARRELGVKRLPNGSAVVESGDHEAYTYEPPYRARQSPSGLVWQVVDANGRVRSTASERLAKRKAEIWNREAGVSP